MLNVIFEFYIQTPLAPLNTVKDSHASGGEKKPEHQKQRGKKSPAKTAEAAGNNQTGNEPGQVRVYHISCNYCLCFGELVI